MNGENSRAKVQNVRGDSSASKIKGLHKNHNRACPNRRGDPTSCDCPWYGKHKGIYKSLSAWSGQEIDPRKKKHAEEVLLRFKAAIDSRQYTPEGEQPYLGAGQRFGEFIREWKTHYADEYDLSSNSLDPMLGVIKAGLGALTMEHLAGASLRIERWLNQTQKERRWSANTWNRYYELLSTLFVRASRWKINSVPRIAFNPMAAIERKVGTRRKFRVRIEECAEEKLLAACEQLNRPQHIPHSQLLTWAKVDEIRRRAAAGERQATVAAAFGISSGLCCQIIKGNIWNPAKYRRGTHGDLMRLRLMAALDTGLRREEMMRVQLKHVSFRPIVVENNGDRHELFVIEVHGGDAPELLESPQRQTTRTGDSGRGGCPGGAYPLRHRAG